MKAIDLIKVIKACKESNVTKFEHDGLKLEFGPAWAVDGSQLPNLIPEQSPEDKEAQMQELGSQLQRQRLDELKISDPLAYEELLHAQELEAEDDE